MKTNKQQTVPSNPEPPKRWLDPFAEWRDHANQWDLSALQPHPPVPPSPSTPPPRESR